MFLVRHALLLLLFTLSICMSRAQTEAGWKALLNNDDTTALRIFNASTTANPKDWQAWLGIAFAHEVHESYRNAWKAYREAIRTAPDNSPLLFAVMSSDIMSKGTDRASGGNDALEQAATRPAEIGIVAAMAASRLADRAVQRGDLEDATTWNDQIGFITKWRVMGPFNNVSGSGYDKVYPPETEDVPTATYENVDGRLVEWTDLKAVRTDGWIDMVMYFGDATGMFYASTYVFNPTERRVHARIGTSGAFKLFINGTEVHSSVDEHNNDLDTYISAVTLPKGWSHVLVKVGAYDIDKCNFLFRITDERGLALRDLKVSTEPQTLAAGNLAAARIENPILAGLRQKLEASNTDVIPALLLAQCLLRNDQATQAELVLRPLVAAYPRSVIVLQLYREALIRGDKTDEATAAKEVIVSSRPDLPVSVKSALSEAFEQDNPDEVERLMQTLEQTLPGTMDYYQYAIAQAVRTNNLIRIRELVREAANRHPDDLSMITAAARLAVSTTRRFDTAVAIVERHLRQSYSLGALLLMADLHKQAGDVDASEAAYAKALEIAPASPGYYVAMADYRATRNENDKAIALLRKALEISPSSTYLWRNLGDIYRSMRDVAQARSCFERALRLNPSDFDVRERLRQVKGDPSPFTLLPLANVDSLITAAESFVDTSNTGSVVLHASKQRVIYEGSGSEVRDETVIKILSIDGIDQFKEYTAWGGNASAVTFEKTVVRKPNGREIPADRSGGLLVFKTLEVGDVIHVRYRVREVTYGRLAKHVVDDYRFDDYVPVLYTSYHLIVPQGRMFKWRSDIAGDTPLRTTTLYGDHYAWVRRDLPAIKPEADMPAYSDVSRSIHVSTVPAWSDIVDWYHDVSRTKARMTFEISEVMDSLAPAGEQLATDEIIRRVYEYITTNVRYSNVSFRQSGIIPQAARKTLITRIGDCKDVATLCIAMLATRGIGANIVLVNTDMSPNAPEPLPSTDFDHAIVRIDHPKGPLFMDLTAPDIPVGCLPAGDLGAFALPILPGKGAPMRLLRSMFPPSNAIIRVRIELSDDSARITQTNTHQGGRTAYYRSAWKDLDEDELQKELTQSLSYDYPDVELSNIELNDFDTLSSTISYSYNAVVPRHVIHAGVFRIVKIPWFSDYAPDPALSYDKRTYPIEREPWIDTVQEFISIDIPEGYEPSGLERSFVREHPDATVRVTSTVDGRTLHLQRTSIARSMFIKPEDYQRYRTFHNDVVDHDRRYLLLVPKGTVVKEPKRKR